MGCTVCTYLYMRLICLLVLKAAVDHSLFSCRPKLLIKAAVLTHGFFLLQLQQFPNDSH
jgi:hypothetical protein